MSLVAVEIERDIHPVDMVEQVAHVNDWEFERSGDDEISMTVAGVWSDYSVSFSWMEDVEALHLACAFDVKVPDQKSNQTAKLLSLINEQLVIGHFDLWDREGIVMYRQALLLNGGAQPNGEQLQTLMMTALDACERYYQAFQFVIWAGHDARDALQSALFETHGTA